MEDSYGIGIFRFQHFRIEGIGSGRLLQKSNRNRGGGLLQKSDCKWGPVKVFLWDPIGGKLLV